MKGLLCTHVVQGLQEKGCVTGNMCYEQVGLVSWAAVHQRFLLQHCLCLCRYIDGWSNAGSR